MSRPPLWALAGLLALAACGSDPRPDRAPNLVLVSIDTLRADHLSCYGYERETSPNIDALAAAGVRCERAYSPTSWTLPAHLSLLSGLAISVHGMCDERLLEVVARPGPPDELPLRGTFLAEVLSRRDYATAGFYTWKYLEPQFGFGSGFDVWQREGHSIYSHPDYAARARRARTSGDAAALNALREEVPHLFDDQRPTSGEAMDSALAWIDGHADQPFFLFLHLFDVHDDYRPPGEYATRFDPDYTGTFDGRGISSRNSAFRADMPRRDFEHALALYDGEIAWVDEQIGRLLERLDALDLAEDTLVVLTSDHGEEFFEHGNKTHRTQLFRESVEVPLIFRWPGKLPEGHVVRGTTGIVDVAPTVYGLFGIDGPAALTGADLSPALRGERENASRPYLTELLVFTEGWAPQKHVGLHWDDQHALLRTDPGFPARATTFDLTENPREEGRGRPLDLASDEGLTLLERIDALRRLYTAQRARALPRGVEARALTEDEWAELTSVGYGGASEGDVEAGDDARLAMDGSLFPDE